MILIIGRHALNQHITKLQPTWALQQPKDIDIIASYDDAIKFLKSEGCTRVEPLHEGKKLHGIKPLGGGKVYHYEAELAWPDSTAESLLTAVWDRSEPLADSEGWRIAPLDVIYALKMSHRYRKNSPHFHKTRRDILTMRALGASIGDNLQAWFKQREKETYTYSHPKLNTTRGKFFAGDGVDYIYDHDSIHQAVKVMGKPAFDFFKPDTAEVFCSKDLFFACDEAIRLNAVYEESCVLALERSVVPHPGVLTPEGAFAKALEKVSTSITSGWFREYAWENHDKALELYRCETEAGRNYISLFESGLKSGIIKPHVKGE
jgi:hypothetical protein